MSPRGGYQGDRTTFGHGNVTEIQRRTWELVEQTGQSEAARILGKSQAAIQSALKGYMFAMGLTGPLPGARVYRKGIKRGTGPRSQLKARIVELETENAGLRLAIEDAETTHAREVERLTERIAELQVEARPWPAVHAKLDAILARPTGVVFAPDHRRVSDGGRTVKAQRKALRPTA